MAHFADGSQTEHEDEALEDEIAQAQPKDDEELASEPEFEDELHQTVAHLSELMMKYGDKCNLCHQPGHWKNECPKKNTKPKGPPPKGKFIGRK